MPPSLLLSKGCCSWGHSSKRLLSVTTMNREAKCLSKKRIRSWRSPNLYLCCHNHRASRFPLEQYSFDHWAYLGQFYQSSYCLHRWLTAWSLSSTGCKIRLLCSLELGLVPGSCLECFLKGLDHLWTYSGHLDLVWELCLLQQEELQLVLVMIREQVDWPVLLLLLEVSLCWAVT